MKWFGLILFSACLVVMSFVYKAAFLDFQTYRFLDKPISITVPHGSSLKTVASLLEDAGLIPDQDTFYWSVRFRQILRMNKGFVRSGEYEFSQNLSSLTILEKMLAGQVKLYRLTIPEGLTSMEIRPLLEKAENLNGDVPIDIPEGSCLAETYTYSKGETRENIVKEAQKDLEIVLNDMWERRPMGFALKSKQEVLILASIVEKETAIATERPMIAAVFLNRIRKGMLLQTDPTVIYAHELKNNQPFSGALYKKHLEIESPFNTYKYPGLPPAPICHVGIEAIRAVLSPAKTNALFFVADGTGGHVFSETYKDHKKNHEKWRKIKKTLNK